MSRKKDTYSMQSLKEASGTYHGILFVMNAREQKAALLGSGIYYEKGRALMVLTDEGVFVDKDAINNIPSKLLSDLKSTFKTVNGAYSHATGEFFPSGIRGVR